MPRLAVLLAIVWRDMVITRSYRIAFVLDAVFGVLNLAVFFFISRTFAHVHSANLHGAPSFFAFAAVGIAITVVIDAASTALAQRLRDEQLTGTLEALLTQPITVGELAFGLAAFPFFFALLRAVFYLALAALWAGIDLGSASLTGFVVVLAAAGAAFSALGVFLGAVVLLVKRGQAIVGMVIFGMGFVSGAFFPAAVLPGWVEATGRYVPTRFAFDGLRAALFRGDGWEGDALALAAYGVLGIPFAIWVFNRVLVLARQFGTLGQY